MNLATSTPVLIDKSINPNSNANLTIEDSSLVELNTNINNKEVLIENTLYENCHNDHKAIKPHLITNNKHEIENNNNDINNDNCKENCI